MTASGRWTEITYSDMTRRAFESVIRWTKFVGVKIKGVKLARTVRHSHLINLQMFQMQAGYVGFPCRHIERPDRVINERDWIHHTEY